MKTSFNVAMSVMVVFLLSVFVSLAESAEKPLKIAGVIFQDDQFMRTLQLGMREGAQKAGAEFLIGNSDGSIDKEIELINSYIQQGIDGLAIIVLHSERSVLALKKAHEKGIKIVISGTILDADFPISVIESDNTELGAFTGAKCREYIETQLGGKAKIGILRFETFLAANSRRRTDGFLSEVKQLPGVEIVTMEEAWLPEQALPATLKMIKQYPDINVIWSANEGGTVGAVMAVKQAKQSGKIVVFGTDVSIQLANFLLADDNILQATTGQQPYVIGTQSIAALMQAFKGEPVERYSIVHGLTLSRTDPAGIQEFITQQKTLLK